MYCIEQSPYGIESEIAKTSARPNEKIKEKANRKKSSNLFNKFTDFEEKKKENEAMAIIRTDGT